VRPLAVHQVIVQLAKISRDGHVRFDAGGADEATIVEFTR
jgi:hypothetical protein